MLLPSPLLLPCDGLLLGTLGLVWLPDLLGTLRPLLWRPLLGLLRPLLLLSSRLRALLLVWLLIRLASRLGSLLLLLGLLSPLLLLSSRLRVLLITLSFLWLVVLRVRRGHDREKQP